MSLEHELKFLQKNWTQRQDRGDLEDDQTYYAYCKLTLATSKRDQTFKKVCGFVHSWCEAYGNRYKDDIRYVLDASKQAYDFISCRRCEELIRSFNDCFLCFACQRGGNAMRNDENFAATLYNDALRVIQCTTSNKKRRATESDEQLIQKKHKAAKPAWKRSSEARQQFKRQSGLLDKKLAEIKYEPDKIVLRCESEFDPEFARQKGIKQAVSRKVFQGTLEDYEGHMTYEYLSWHEVFVKNAPTRLFVDLDGFRPHIKCHDMITTFEEHFIPWFNDTFAVQLPPNSWLWLESTKYKPNSNTVIKNSLHGILNTQWVFNITHQAVIFKAFMAHLRTISKPTFCVKELLNEHVFDLAPYAFNKSLRIERSGKITEYKRTVNRVRGHFAVQNHMFDSFITYLPPESSRVALDESHESWFLSQRSKRSTRESKSVIEAASNHQFAIQHAMDDYMHRHLKITEYKITKTKKDKNAIIIETDVCFCNQKQSDHRQSDKIFYVIDTVRWTVTQCCLAGGCAEKESFCHPVLPPEFTVFHKHKTLGDLLKHACLVQRRHYNRKIYNEQWYMDRLMPFIERFLCYTMAMSKNVCVQAHIDRQLDILRTKHRDVDCSIYKKKDVTLLFEINDLVKTYSHMNLIFSEGKKGKSKVKNIIKLWSDHLQRKTVDKIEFCPRMTRTEPNVYNLYGGFDITTECAKTLDVDAKLAGPLLNHIKTIWCRNNMRLYEYVLNWFARVYQKPWLLSKVVIVLKSQPGAGKGMVMQFFEKILGCRYFWHLKKIANLTGDYTAPDRLTACLVFSDEAHFGGSRKEANAFKTLTTEERFMVNIKNKPQFQIQNYVNLVLASNDERIIAAGTNMRRYVCLELDNQYAGKKTPQSKAHFNKVLAAPILSVAKFFATRNVEDFDPTEIPETELGQAQQMLNFSPLQKWWHTCLTNASIRHRDDYEDGVINLDPPNDGFDNLIKKESLHASLIHFMKRNRVNFHHTDALGHQGSFQKQFKHFKAYRKSSKSFNPRLYGRPAYQLFDLKTCRLNFEKHMGWSTHDWEN